MVALVLRLRFAQLTHALRRPPVQVLGLTILLLLAITIATYLSGAFAGLADLDVGQARGVAVLHGSGLVAGFLLVPLLTAADDPADPRVFASLGVPPARIARGLAVSAIVSVPVLLTLPVLVSQVVGWARHPDADGSVELVALLAAVIAFATIVIGSRLMRSVAVIVFATRRLREFAGVLGSFGLLALLPFVLASLIGLDGIAAPAGLADTLASTPLGAVWAAPAEALAGDTGAAWLLLLISAVTAAVLWGLWRLLVGAMARMGAGPDPAVAIGPRGLGWFDVFPRNAVGAIAARSATYWMRDSRYRVALAAIPVVSLVVPIPFLVIGVAWHDLALLPLPVACLFMGWLLHNDLSHDSSALWLHVASNVSGIADRVGRVIPVLILGVVVIAVFAPVSAIAFGDWSVLAPLIGVCLCLLLTGTGISSFMSVLMPYATVRPGGSPFAQPQAPTGGAGQGIAFALTIVATIPALVLGAFFLLEGGAWGVRTLITGAGVGVLVLVAGVFCGARYYSRRAPELLAFTMRS